jgi:hypothetical protein
MLASWLRLKYPSAVDGAIAASAPIWSFKGPFRAFLRDHKTQRQTLCFRRHCVFRDCSLTRAGTHAGLEPAYDTGSYAEVVTYDTTVTAGAAAGCTDNLRAAWQQVLHRSRAGVNPTLNANTQPATSLGVVVERGCTPEGRMCHYGGCQCILLLPPSRGDRSGSHVAVGVWVVRGG